MVAPPASMVGVLLRRSRTILLSWSVSCASGEDSVPSEATVLNSVVLARFFETEDRFQMLVKIRVLFLWKRSKMI